MSEYKKQRNEPKEEREKDMKIRTIMLIGALLATFAIAAVACSSEPAEPAISEAQMRSIVADAVAQSQPAPQPQVSADEIMGMVNAAMAAMPQPEMPEQVSAQEISSMVQSAVEGAAMEGASPEEIKAMVESAVMASTEDAVTAADVQSAISNAVMESQANMITSEDVDKAVSSAVMMATEGALSAEDVRSILTEGAQDALTEEQVAAIVSKALEERDMMMEMEDRETIIFSDLNWTSAQVQNRIAQYIVEKGYGYPTDVVFGATLPLFNGLRAGDTHVTMEIWLPNQDEAWMEAQAEGQVVSVGESLGKDWQSAFVIPAYLQEQYPELDSIDDLKDDQYKMLFATAETGGKARLVSCVIGWACETVNAAQIEGYGLADHVHVVNPGDGAAANADLYGAYDKEEPWLGYQWGTNDPPLLLDLVRLEEPAYTDECWFTTKACAYEDATILIAVQPEILTRAPDVVAMLRNWGFNIDRYKAVAAWSSENMEATANDAALWWLNGNADVWSEWVTPEAAAAIDAALMAGEIPEGWPTG